MGEMIDTLVIIGVLFAIGVIIYCRVTKQTFTEILKGAMEFIKEQNTEKITK